MSSKFSVFAAYWWQAIPGTTLFKHPLSPIGRVNLVQNSLGTGRPQVLGQLITQGFSLGDSTRYGVFNHALAV